MSSVCGVAAAAAAAAVVLRLGLSPQLAPEFCLHQRHQAAVWRAV